MARRGPKDSRTVYAIAAGLAASAGVIGACIIAEPPTTLPTPPQQRPTILRAVPSNNRVLGVLPPLGFVVDVELDPTREIKWRLFVDYDPLHQDQKIEHGELLPDPGASEGGVRSIGLTYNVVPELDRCHVIEGIVAYDFRDPDSPHSIDESQGGGDSIVWIYSPNGDMSGCPVFDAGIDGALPEGGPD